jgi:hypothetical protein
MSCIAGYIPEATLMSSTRWCRGSAGASTVVLSTSAPYVSSSRRSVRYSTSSLSSIAGSLFANERDTMLNAERNSTSDILSDNSSCHASIDPTLLVDEHPSSHRPPCLTSAPGGQDPWASMLATIHQLSSLVGPDAESSGPVWGSRCGSGPFRPRKTDGGNVHTFTVTVVEELSNALFSLCWHDPTLCNYQEQVWSPCVARVSGRCALSGKRIGRGDAVYRPRVRGPARPLNGDAMILASELVKDHTRA